MSDGDEDAWVSLGAMAAQVIMGVASENGGRAPSLRCEDRPAAKSERPDTRMLEPTRRSVAAHPRRFRLHSGADPVEEANASLRTAHPNIARHSGTAAGTEEKMAAPAPRESETGAGAQGVKRLDRAQHHDAGRGGAVVIQFDFRPKGGTYRTQEPATVVAARLTCPLAKRPARLRR